MRIRRTLPDCAPVPPVYHQRGFRLPPGATEIVLVRHGASEAAIPGEPFPMRDGHGDPALSPEGEAQALAVAERLAAEPPSALFVTPLRRTAMTAAPFVERSGLQPAVIDNLREVSLGEWEGGEFRIRMAEADPVALQAVAEERWDVIPGAERMEAFAQRVRSGIEAIVAAVGPDVSVAAVVHGGVIGEACRQATDSRPFAFVHADNGSFTRVVVAPGGPWLLRSFNDTAHLD
jgi:2,3-bisphosphoglycerate-dependent phosphoglycerate mutase